MQINKEIKQIKLFIHQITLSPLFVLFYKVFASKLKKKMDEETGRIPLHEFAKSNGTDEIIDEVNSFFSFLRREFLYNFYTA